MGSFRPQIQCIMHLHGLKAMFYNDESDENFTKSENMKFQMFDMLKRSDCRKSDLGQYKWK